MAVTYPLSLPSVHYGFTGVTLRQANVSGYTSSPYTGEQYVYSYPGEWWEADVSFPKITRENIGAWRVFFAKLKGAVGTVLLNEITMEAPLGSAGTTPGTPLVNGADQTGNTLDIDGLPISVSGYLLEGDFIQLGSGLSTRLHMVLEDVDTDESGEASLLLWPSLRESPADDAEVIVSDCKGLFRRKSSTYEDAAEPGPKFTPQSCTFVEAL